MNEDSIPTNMAANSETMETNVLVEDSSKIPNKSSILRKAIEETDYRAIESILADGADVNEVLIPTGPQAGYTALHMACHYDDLTLAILLAETYKANVNAVAEDGVQPLHIVCFHGEDIIARVLLDVGANVNIEFDKSIHEKYAKDKLWSDDFGGTMTMLTFTILNKDREVMLLLMEYNPDVTVKSVKNKTLLMYALEEDNDWAAMTIAAKMVENVQEDVLNARDSDGRHAIHYILHENKYGGFRYDEKQLKLGLEDREYLKSLIIRVGPDAYAPINGDPDTLLINSAAYRSCYEILQIILPLSASIEQSKALRLATSPIEDPQKYLRKGGIEGRNEDFDAEKEVEKRRKLSLEWIVKDLHFRRSFGLAVPEEEIKLMNEFIAKDDEVRNIVKIYQKEFIEELLRKKAVHFGDKSLNFYELAVKVFDDEAVKILVEDKELVSAVEAAEIEEDGDDNLKYFFTMITARIEKMVKQN